MKPPYRSGRRPGHTTGALREKAALYGLELGVECKGDGAFRYTFEDAHGRIFGQAKGMMHAEAFLAGVETGWTLLLEGTQKKEVTNGR